MSLAASLNLSKTLQSCNILYPWLYVYSYVYKTEDLNLKNLDFQVLFVLQLIY